MHFRPHRVPPAATRHVILAILLTGLLTACQTNLAPELDGEDGETLAINVEPMSEDSQVDGETASGTIVVEIEAKNWMREVRFYLDDQLSLTLTSAPFRFVLDTRTLDDGPHTVRVDTLHPSRRTQVTGLVELNVRNAAASPVPIDRGTTLRGDPGFSPSHLTTEQRTHYERLMEEIADSDDIFDHARSGDIFKYGRQVYSYIQAVLTAFRITGDLALLDHVDVIAELMRAQLRDGWYGTLDGTDGTKDGYLNWIDKYETPSMYRGKDLTKINEMMTHATVAIIAYALEANRDLESPSGRDYAAHADFWKDYLVNHFEAKWREREDEPTGFPLMSRPHTTTHQKWLQWHYYMGKLTGDQAYLDEANAMADDIWNDFYLIDTAAGPAFVWARSLGSLDGSNAHLLQPLGYARHVFGASVDLHLEGFHNWAVDENMARFARTFTEFVIDTNDPIKNGFAPDIGGGRPRLHLEVDTSWSRVSITRYSGSNYALIGAWDTTAEMRDLTATIQDRYPSRNTTSLAVALLIDAALTSRTETATTTATAR